MLSGKYVVEQRTDPFARGTENLYAVAAAAMSFLLTNPSVFPVSLSVVSSYSSSSSKGAQVFLFCLSFERLLCVMKLSLIMWNRWENKFKVSEVERGLEATL